MEGNWFKHSVEKELEKNPDLKEEMLREIRKYLEDQPHLPQALSDVELIHHIQSCDFDITFTKTVIETNYTIRSKAIFFQNRDPHSKDSQDIAQYYRQWIVSDVDKERRMAIIAKLEDFDPSKYNFNCAARHTTMLMDLIRLEYGTVPGFIAVVDLTGFSFTHLIKAPIGSLRNFMRYLQEGSPLKISGLHLINTKGSIIDKVMVVLRPLLSEKITKMLFIHPGYETLYDHGIHPEKMPTEYGGMAGNSKETAEETFNQIIRYTQYFKEEELMRIDESKRPKRTKYFGFF